MKYSYIFASLNAAFVASDDDGLHLLQTMIQKHGHGGPSVGCPAGYSLVAGGVGPNWANCPGTTVGGYCVLPKASAYELCDSDPSCTMVSHTSNHGWLGSYGSHSVSPSKGTLQNNAQWSSCVKDPQFVSCPEGYDRVQATGENWANCPGTTVGGYCVLPNAAAYELCDSDPSCTMVSHTTNKGWLAAHGVGSVSPSKGSRTTMQANAEWMSCVKKASWVKLNPPIHCPSGYEGVQGVASGNWANCPGTTVGGYCVVPKVSAYELCDSDPLCTMVSHTSNGGWLRAHGQNSVSPGRGGIQGNGEWASCRKVITTTTTTTTAKMFETCPGEGKANTNECPPGCTFVDNCAQCELAARSWGKTYSTAPAKAGDPRPRGCYRNRKHLFKCNTANPEGPYRGKYPICQAIV